MRERIYEPGRLTLEDLRALYRGQTHARVDEAAFAGIEEAAAIVAAAAAGDLSVYGINTGFGKLAQTRISPADTATLQRNLILSHACGVGSATGDAVTSLMLHLKINALSRGASGVRAQTLRLMQALLDHAILPLVPQQGSVGASGDLAPLAHMAGLLIGEGQARMGGRTLPAEDALAQAGLEPIALGPKEGLALINGTQFSCAYALAGLFDFERLIQASLIIGAMSTDAAMGSSTPFRAEIHALRGLPGQIACARALAALLADSPLRASHLEGDDRVQDPYCLRCQPQVAGAALDLARFAGGTLAIEANGVTDNPIVLRETGEVVSGGNFHAEPVAMAADQLAIAIAETGAIAQRRIATLVDPALSFGLPPFLTPNPGLNSGFMIAEVTSAALMSENKHRAAAASVDSTPTSANQEDHVSMAAYASRRLMDMNDNLAGILAIEFLCAAQGVELRKHPTSPPLQAAIAMLRAKVPHLENDRALSGDIEAAKALIVSGDILSAAPAGLLPSL